LANLKERTEFYYFITKLISSIFANTPDSKNTFLKFSMKKKFVIIFWAENWIGL